MAFAMPSQRATRPRGSGVTAVLGPTNTGKTHLAIERMLAHSSGLIGLPLRLLAREVYNKVVATVGPEAVALVTGEEKIKPQSPRFWVSTVEAMPRDLDVAFVAIDEIQLAADLERGHVFTDRMLHRRGREETLVLGAATMRQMVEKLLPGANILSRPRMSQLTHAGDRKITRLPRRSAIVAFSADEVYAIAELVRRQRGGAAVVLGALSPRTRNAQVALYQSGDVDYLIATDAIGMGLNLDVDHVAFASDRKYDGYQFRRLNAGEFGQIAGRAGRATRDGTFGTTGRCEPFEPELVHALEAHAFDPVKVLQWRNTDLDYASIDGLQNSLARVPDELGLTRAPVAEDIRVLEHLGRDDDVRARASSPRAIARLWEVCQIPDYRKISPALHAELAATLFGFLGDKGTIADDWFARQVSQADHPDGDIDALSARIAQIRTWTFVANRPDWLADPEHWQGVTRTVEDRLSDALHERLTQRFVDRRTSVLMRRLRENTMLDTEIGKTGEVLVEGHPVGRLEGFRFAADPSAGSSEARALRAAAQKALAGEIEARANRFSAASDDQFVLTSDGTIRWTGDLVGKLTDGADLLSPRVTILADEQLTGAARELVQARLDLWVKTHIGKLLGPLVTLRDAPDLSGLARGIAFQIVEALGVLERQRVQEEVKSLDQSARASLRTRGVRFGAYHLYLPALLKPAARALAAQLWALKHGGPAVKGIDEIPHMAASGRTSMRADTDAPAALYRALGYRVCGERAIRVDILERLADLIRPALAWRPGSPGERPPGAFEGGGFVITPAMTSLAGCPGEEFASVLRSLGYRMDRRPRPAAPPTPVAPPATEFSASGEADSPPHTPRADIPDPSADDQTPPVDTSGEDAAAGPQGGERPIDLSTDGDILDAAPEDGAMGISASGDREESAPAPRDDAGPPAETAAPVVEAEAPGARASAPEQAPAYAPSELADTSSVSGAEATQTAEDSPAVSVSPDTAAATDQPDLVEVWRPGRRERGAQPERGKARPPRRPRREPSLAPQPHQPTPAAAGEAQAAPPEASPQPADADQASPREARRPDRGPRHHREGRRPPPPGGGERRDRGPHHTERKRDFRGERNARPPAREPREKPIDPDSPFAKLLALKEQLENSAKERQ